MNILAELRSRFAAALAPLTSDPAPYLSMVRPAQDVKFGDFQANCAMPLVKEHPGAKSRDLAEKIIANLNVSDLCEVPEIAGPGFINLRLKDSRLAAQAAALTADERLGVSKTASPKSIVVDFSAPNVAKPMHVGHLRSTVIGDSICRILRFLGHAVIGDNHIGDWGTQFGMIIYGYKHFLDRPAFETTPVAELARLYRLVNQLCDYHELAGEIPKIEQRIQQRQAAIDAAQSTLLENDKAGRKQIAAQQTELGKLQEELEAAQAKRDGVAGDPLRKSLADAHPDIVRLTRLETAKLHAGDAENVALWNQFLPQCLAEIQKVYDRLSIHFDMSLGESYFQPMLADVVADLQRKGIARESDGALCVFLEDNAAPFIVRKGDGAYTYATTDLATIRYRVDELHADLVLYVVDARQSEHFKLLFGTAQAWGYNRTEFRHISFGTIMGPDKRPYKTRSGDTVGLESLLNESIERARKIVDENDDSKKEGAELDEAARAKVAEAVGLGGIKYADLRHNRESDYVFSWEKMLATTGDTATYMQYACARIGGIFRKSGVGRENVRTSGGDILLTLPAERALALQLCRFSEALEDAVAEFRPNVLTQYLFETANSFSAFYNDCPVKNEPDETLRTSRFLLCDLTGRVLEKGLGLLGIETPEQM